MELTVNGDLLYEEGHFVTIIIFRSLTLFECAITALTCLISL